MAALTGQTIASTYPQLLKTTAAGGLSGSPTIVEDGDGTASALSISTGGASVAGTLAASGNFAIDTTKFTVVAASGNTAVAGTFDTAGNFRVNVNKLTVDAITGNTAVAGTFISSGNATFSSNVNVIGTLSASTFTPSTLIVSGTGSIAGNFDVNTSKFTANATTGNCAASGTITAAGFNCPSGTYSGGSLAVDDIIVNGGAFQVYSSGYTFFAADIDVASDLRVNASKFIVVALTGDTITAGNASVGSLSRGAPVIKTSNFTVAATENWIINNKSGSALVVTLPSASSWVGREINFLSYTAFGISSASSNVVNKVGSLTSVICTTVAGETATLVSNGTNWQLMK